MASNARAHADEAKKDESIWQAADSYLKKVPARGARH